MDPETLKRLRDAIEELGPELTKLNDEPNTAKSAAPVAPVAPVPVAAAAPAASKFLLRSDMDELRGELKKLTTPELYGLLGRQARRPETGIPVEAWMAAGGRAIEDAMQQDAFVRKAVDSSGASALIRQDLEPVLYEIFIREFPYWDRVGKEPANGLVHAWNQVTGYGDAVFMTELGTVTDDVSTYLRKTTPIATLATRRGISLKAGFAVAQGGAGYNVEQQELRGGIVAMSHKLQKTIFQGNATATGGTATNDYGLYDANSFDGFRKTFTTNTAYADLTGSTPDDLRTAIADLATTIMQAGNGTTSIVYAEPSLVTKFAEQQDKNVRYMNNRVPVAAGVMLETTATPFGDVPVASIRGDSIGEYTPLAKGSGTWSDMYLVDESAISVPYLGSAGIQVLDIPIGISGQLTHLFIMFILCGLAVKVEPFQGKLTVKLS